MPRAPLKFWIQWWHDLLTICIVALYSVEKPRLALRYISFFIFSLIYYSHRVSSLFWFPSIFVLRAADNRFRTNLSPLRFIFYFPFVADIHPQCLILSKHYLKPAFTKSTVAAARQRQSQQEDKRGRRKIIWPEKFFREGKNCHGNLETFVN